MSDYIDRDKLYQFLSEQICKETGTYTRGRNVGINIARSALHNIQITPSADVVPVVHGNWIEKPYLLGISNFCSECRENFGMPHGKFNFCPNCGVKMDLEEVEKSLKEQVGEK